MGSGRHTKVASALSTDVVKKKRGRKKKLIACELKSDEKVVSKLPSIGVRSSQRLKKMCN